MAITSSVIADESVQRDGRRYITEHHTDHQGVVHAVTYLADAGFDTAEALAARAKSLGDGLQNAEITANIAQIVAEGRLAELTFEHSTPAQNRTALRQAYQSATRTEAIFIADFLNTLTDGQLQSAFGLTPPQVANLRANKLAPAAAIADEIRAAAGA